MASVSTDDVAAACQRLTGDSGRRAKHGRLFRLKVTTSDGKTATVTAQVDDHPGECRPYVLNDIRRRWRIPDGISTQTALKDWAPAQLKQHLEQFTQEQLRPPSYRR